MKTHTTDASLASINMERKAEFRNSGFWGDATILDWFHLSARSVPDQLAVVDRQGGMLTFRELDVQSDIIAKWLVDEGISPGDVVSIQLPNWVEYTIIHVACLKVGAIINPLSTSLRLSELSELEGDCKTVVSFHPAEFHGFRYEDLVDSLPQLVPSLKSCVLVDKDSVTTRSSSTLQRILDTPCDLTQLVHHQGNGDDIAAVLFTSGSESKPKGVMLSHNNLIYSERTFVSSLAINASDSMFMSAPVSHATGFMHGVTMPLLTQIPSVLCDSTSADHMVEMLVRYKATGTMSVPTVAESILEFCADTETQLPDLRFYCCGGAPVERELVDFALKQNISMHSVYGSTESAPHTMTSVFDPVAKVLDSDGRACWGTQVRVVDPQTRKQVPVGTVGEEASRGPGVFMGYINQPELTRSCLDSDGWYYSGDLCKADPDGYIRIVGRIKDVIIRGGVNISPTEIENLLLTHPDIREVCVIGVQDAVLGERIGACIVTQSGNALSVDELKSFVDRQHCAKCKTPEYVFLLDALPRTPSGKVFKSKLIEQFSIQFEGTS